VDSLNRHAVSYGRKTIHFDLVLSERKTMNIVVHPDNYIVVKAPINTDIATIEKQITKRARWISRQVTFFEQYMPATPPRYFVNGETHLFLGKQYRLKITQSAENSVRLARGFLYVTCKATPTAGLVRTILTGWYREQARFQFMESLDRCWKNFHYVGIRKPDITVKRMKKRWGCLSASGTITLNPALVGAPTECIDYVITHELCHCKFKDHSDDFYSLLESVLPNWWKIKQKLESTMQ